MKRKPILLFLAALIVVFALSLVACDSGYTGKYYEYKQGAKVESSWIELSKDSWTDDEGLTGRLEVDGDNITAYSEILGVEDVLFTGTAKDGVLTFELIKGMTYKYYKDGAYDTGSSGSTNTSTNKFTVTFNSNGGSTVSSVQVKEGAKLTAITQPSRSLYVFDGWYKNSALTEIWNFDVDTVTSNLTLYAKWKEEVRITSVGNATISGNEITMVVADSTEDVDMNGKIVLSDSQASWKLYYDKLGQMEIPTNIATNKNETLNEGSSRFYIVVKSSDGTQTKTYVLDIYKKYKVTIYVYGADPLVPIDTLSAMTLGTMPTPQSPSLEGYTVTGWESSSVAPKATIPKDCSKVVTLTAKLKANTYTATLDADGASLDSTTRDVTYGSSVELPIPTKTGYSFAGWYIGDEQVTAKDGKTTWTYASDKTLTAKYRANVYSVTAEKNIENAGTVSATSTADSAILSFDVNSTNGATAPASQTVTADVAMKEPSVPKADGYLFLGWYNEPSCATRFDFTQNIYRDATAYAGWYQMPYTESVAMYDDGSEISVEIEENNEQYIYFSPTTSGTYTLYYKNSGSYTSSAARMLIYDQTSYNTIKEETQVASTSYQSYSFSATEGNLYYVRLSTSGSSSAVTCKLQSENTSSVGGYFVVPSNIGSVNYDTKTTLTATSNSGYIWSGWYLEGKKVSDEKTIEIACRAKNVVYTAKFDKCTSHTLDDNCVCTKCGATSHTLDDNCLCSACGKTVHWIKNGKYCRHGNSIYFGSYPQTKVTDSTLTSALTSAAGTLPTSSNKQQWTSYGYYISGSVSNYMWYQDIEKDGEKYRGVYFTSYRPYYTTYSSSSSYSYQGDNGYNASTVYWFKYEPIKWTILNESGGKALILADLALDSQQFDYDGSYSNNYKESTIRKWLNDTFYNTAFNALQKALIETTTVDNSVASTGYGSNSYACADTDDNIFLLSYKECSTYLNSETLRQKKSTDYAKSQGCWQSTSSNYEGNCYWWLRSPYFNYSYYARGVNYDGYIYDNYYVDHTNDGVLPALTISLAG